MEAAKYDPATTNIMVMQNSQDTTEKLIINGVDAYYIQAGEGGRPLAGKNRLGWLDEQRGLHYTISDNPNSPLTKEDLVRIAEDLIVPKPKLVPFHTNVPGMTAVIGRGRLRSSARDLLDKHIVPQ